MKDKWWHEEEFCHQEELSRGQELRRCEELKAMDAAAVALSDAKKSGGLTSAA